MVALEMMMQLLNLTFEEREKNIINLGPDLGDNDPPDDE